MQVEEELVGCFDYCGGGEGGGRTVVEGPCVAPVVEAGGEVEAVEAGADV